jgi:nitroreductase
MKTIKLLLTRRSVKAVTMTDPGPDDEALETILRAGMRVPDHGKLAPWRFIVFRGKARAAFGEVLAEIYKKNTPEAKESQLQFNRDMPMRAPVMLAVLSRRNPEHKIPLWEQELSAGAACQNMLVAATALGFAAQWITEWPAYDRAVIEALGGGPNDRIAGFLYFGTAREIPEDRVRPDFDEIVSFWPDKARFN